MLKKVKKTKKSSKTKRGTVRKRRKARKVEFSGVRHFGELVKAAKRSPQSVYNILSAIRGPDDLEDAIYKEKYTGVIRTWIFGAEQCGGMVQSKEAPVTEQGWEKLYTEAVTDIMKGKNVKLNHYLGHIHEACYAIRALYASGTFKEGT